MAPNPKIDSTESTHAVYALAIAELEDSSVRFSEAELADIKEDFEKSGKSSHCMKVIQENLGSLFPEQGVVGLEEYEDSKKILRNVKKQVIEDFSTSDEDRRIWEEV